MKRNIKALFISTFTAIVLLVTYSCVDPEDLITAGAKEGGAIVTVSGTSGKVLGVPNSTTGEVTFTDNELTMNIDVSTGGESVDSYSVVKQFNGGDEVLVESFNSVPHTTTFTTLDEFLAGTGKAATDLRIGDTYSFRVKLTLSDGRVIYSAPANGRYNVVVNCSSNLAGTYTVTGIYNRPASGIVGQVVGPRTEVLTEISPGIYGTEESGHWDAESQLGFSTCPIIFSDVCGELTIATQNLCDAYSNEVTGTGTVDSATGNLHFVYIITGGNERDYVFDFVKN